MKNNYSIKPKLINYTNNYDSVLDLKTEHFDAMKKKEVQPYFIILIICIALYQTIFGKIITVLSVLHFLYYNYEISKRTSLNRKKIEEYKRTQESKTNFENNQRINLASQMSLKLNETLKKSQDLLFNGIPLQLDSAKNILEKIKFEFKENALIPFWDEVENFVEVMNSYQDSLQIIETNQKTYYNIINSTENDFPKEFSTKIDQTIPLQLINDFKSIQREAFKKFEFANLWEQRKTQKILAFGFSNLQDAIYNMSDSITSSINGLNDSIISLNYNITEGFKTLSNDINAININNKTLDMSTTNKILEDNLTRIDEKLYYIQYNRKPFKPFNDYLAPER